MNFVLPQFIEMEARIVGPLTLKQFMYIASGAGLSFFIYFTNTLGTTISIVLIILIMSACGALAFVKIDGIALPNVLVNALRFALSSKIYLWKNAMIAGGAAVIPTQGEVAVQKAPVSKKIQLVKKGQITQTKKILETKR
jgi:hypothetical protein